MAKSLKWHKPRINPSYTVDCKCVGIQTCKLVSKQYMSTNSQMWFGLLIIIKLHHRTRYIWSTEMMMMMMVIIIIIIIIIAGINTHDDSQPSHQAHTDSNDKASSCCEPVRIPWLLLLKYDRVVAPQHSGKLKKPCFFSFSGGKPAIFTGTSELIEVHLGMRHQSQDAVWGGGFCRGWKVGMFPKP